MISEKIAASLYMKFNLDFAAAVIGDKKSYSLEYNLKDQPYPAEFSQYIIEAGNLNIFIVVIKSSWRLQ